MTVAKAGLVALALISGCLRFGYSASQQQDDAGKTRDAAVSGHGGMGGSTHEAGKGGSAGRGGAGGRGGVSALDAGVNVDDADSGGIDVNQALGNTGLRVNDILGFYSSPTWGDMVLRTHGAEIWGVYRYDGGTIVGEITSDGVFAGWWTQRPTREGTNAGEVEFRWMQVNGTTIHLDGRWRYGTAGTWLPNWDLDLVTDRSPPSSLTSGFDNPDDFKQHP